VRRASRSHEGAAGQARRRLTGHSRGWIKLTEQRFNQVTQTSITQLKTSIKNHATQKITQLNAHSNDILKEARAIALTSG
jgi:hypothetical protein